MSDDWKEVCSNTWRLELQDGHLYRVSDDRGTQMVYVPCSTISQSLYDLSQSIGEINSTLDSIVGEVGNSGAVRVIDMGN